ncbi:hypothetical protein [Luteococcus sp.]|uniref:hypothetical protein n=1 Tax=Luteococcus sp. TaxID=1969402 RepID=UPI003734D769
MLVFALAIGIIAAIGVAVTAVVLVGMKGAFRESNPQWAARLAVAAQHMNGDAEPPQVLVDFVTEQRGAARGGRSVGERIGGARTSISAPRAAVNSRAQGPDEQVEELPLAARTPDLAPAQA